MSIQTKPFGFDQQGSPVTQYTMTNARGASASVIDFGGILTNVVVPDKAGNFADVVCGFDSVEPYLVPHGSMGDTVGRYGNRICDGVFTLDGVTYQLAKNNGKNHLHGGFEGFSRKMWEVTPVEGAGEDRLILHYVSPDGEENYPGTLDVTVTYSWSDACDLTIRYEAVTDKPTLCNMTDHSYFNLAGHACGTVKGHLLRIDADAITAVDSTLIPVGYMPVAGTPFDFRTPALLSNALSHAQDDPQMIYGHGFDHNFVLRKGEAMGLAARLTDPASGRVLEVITDQPGVQCYTASCCNLHGGKDGADYGQYCAVCLETQHFPDSPNHPEFLGTTVLRPGEKYDTTTIYAFRAE